MYVSNGLPVSLYVVNTNLSLAAFDEINNLSSNKDTGSGGGSSGVTTPTFEVDTSYLEKVEGIMKKIGGWVLAIAAGLGAWKIASAFGADLKKCIGWFMTISGLVLGITGFLDAWNEGLNWDNLIQILTGLAARQPPDEPCLHRTE